MRATISSHLAACATVILLLVATPEAAGADPDNCLSCHRYRGLARLSEDGSTVRLFHVDPRYYDRALGPHARLRCTACHPRDEVEVIPHRPVSPVNCTTTCHLSVPGRPEIVFGHDTVAGMLESSVHNMEVLRNANRLLGSPLRPGQSECLLCHDEPTFQRSQQAWATEAVPVGRCAVCHDQPAVGLPGDTRYYYWHVHARSRPARSNQDLVRVCAICHSNEKIRKSFELEDATASYLVSFHGKAMLLGSEQTAGCLDCHVDVLENVHVMRSHTQEGSPTHPGQLASTCRSTSCHPAAGQRVSSAAVHLDLATSRGAEFFIAVLFVLLIIFTFGPSVVLTALEMLQVVCARHDADHHRRQALARQLLDHPLGRRALRRFSPHQRVQHWILVVCFTVLVMTGFPIKFADRPWAAWVIDLLGGLGTARLLHRWAGLLLIVGFLFHLVYIVVHVWRLRRSTRKSWTQTVLDLPMVARWNDWKQLWHLLGYLLFLRRTRPSAGRFSLEEKFEYFGVFWGCALLGVTGVLMWLHPQTTRYLPGRTLTVASLIHTFEAFLALLHVGVIHLIGVVFSPAVFPVSPAMFTGRTPPEELAEAHAAMLDEAQRQIHSGLAAEVQP